MPAAMSKIPGISKITDILAARCARLSLQQLAAAMVTKEFCPPSFAIAMTNLGCNGPNPILINAIRPEC
jgi:hypothetical protein